MVRNLYLFPPPPGTQTANLAQTTPRFIFRVIGTIQGTKRHALFVAIPLSRQSTSGHLHKPACASTIQWEGTHNADHTNRGDDADEFDPRRFIRMRKDNDPNGGVVPPNQLPPMAFPVWGVAPHVCPARYYASTGVLVLVALVVLRLDISPAPGEGCADPAWRELEDGFNFSAVSRPTEPVRVSVRPREHRRGSWNVVVGRPETRLQFSVA